LKFSVRSSSRLSHSRQLTVFTAADMDGHSRAEEDGKQAVESFAEEMIRITGSDNKVLALLHKWKVTPEESDTSRIYRMRP